MTIGDEPLMIAWMAMLAAPHRNALRIAILAKVYQV